jgi:imidazolonepropionase-like amidohydrolase
MCQVCYSAELQGAGINPCVCGAPSTQAAFSRIDADLRRREVLGGMASVVGMFAGFGLAPRRASAQGASRPVVLTNFRLFNGVDPVLTDGVDLVIDGDRIVDLPPRGQGPAEATIIDCRGMTVIPGLIDCHWHATLAGVSQITALTADIAYVHLRAAQEAGETLRRGFTTVRDVGGPAFALKRAIDEGVVDGPRIFPAGAMISQTSGHGDFRQLHELPRRAGEVSYTEEVGLAAIADGADAVLQRVREQLMQGASQIKMMAGGGVSSLYDPLLSTQYLEEELRAGVRAAADWDTYVCVHVYTPEGIKRAIRAGVRCIEHGQLADREAVEMMAGEGVWWSLQPFLLDEDANPKSDPRQRADQERVAAGTIQAYEWARELGINSAFGTDILMNPAGTASQGRQLSKLARFMPPLEALKRATGDAGRLLAESGRAAPYDGPLGRITPGAFADLLVVDGDPSQSLEFLGTPETSLQLILKGGQRVAGGL